MNHDLVTVATFQFAPAAEATRLALEQDGILAFLTDLNIVNMDWLLGNAVGNIKLQVRQSEAAVTREILARLQTENEQAAAEAEASDMDRCLACGADFPEDATRCPQCGWTYAR